MRIEKSKENAKKKTGRRGKGKGKGDGKEKRKGKRKNTKWIRKKECKIIEVNKREKRM